MQTKKRSVAILTPYLHHHEGHGGITPWLEELVAIYLADGWKVTILTNAHSHVMEETPPMNEKAEMLTLGYHKVEALKKLKQYLQTVECDLFISAGHRYNQQALLAFSKLKNISTKLIVSVHENVSEGSKNMSWLRKKLRYRTIKKLFPRADAVVCVSKGVVEDLKEIAGAASHRLSLYPIYNPLISDCFYQKADLDPEGVNETLIQSPFILSTGRLSEQKNYSLLINAFSKISNKCSENLIILGEGEQRPLLEKLIADLKLEDRVFLPGFVKNPLPYVKRAKIFALSSRWEGLSYSLIEAIALGVTPVSTSCPSGPSEVLGDGKYGYLVDDFDPSSYASQLLEAIDSPFPDKLLKEQAQLFHVDKVGKEFLDLSCSLLKGDN